MKDLIKTNYDNEALLETLININRGLGVWDEELSTIEKIKEDYGIELIELKETGFFLTPIGVQVLHSLQVVKKTIEKENNTIKIAKSSAYVS